MFPYSPAEVARILLPLLSSLEQRYRKGRTLIIGLQGGQGTGKTTLARFLQQKLQKRGYTVIRFSLDDFYESAAKRKKLARKYPHNLFYQIPRGMPGTHRVSYLRKVLQKLKAGKPLHLPVFDKSLQQGYGDLARKTIAVKGRVDFVLFEGWCLGLPLISSRELLSSCRKNRISLQQLDPQLQYHPVMLGYLKPYQPLWKFIDYLIMLQPDSAALHQKWRWQQERELWKKTGKGMSKKQVEHFVQVYLPLTYGCYEKVKADATLHINKEHRIYKMKP